MLTLSSMMLFNSLIATRSCSIVSRKRRVTQPSFSVSWSSHALGGIISKRLLMTEGSTVHEFGEAGSEAILPLNPFWKKMDEIASNVQGGNTINIYVNGSDKDPRQIAEEVKRVLIKETNNRRLAWQ